jgi:uncharacterized protein YbjT (DUF2867 family)
MNNKTAFVTGATGLLGSNLCRSLVAQGWQVKGLVRSIPQSGGYANDKAQRFLDEIEVQLIQGDMEQVSAFTEALTGVDVVMILPVKIRMGTAHRLSFRRCEAYKYLCKPIEQLTPRSDICERTWAIAMELKIHRAKVCGFKPRQLDSTFLTIFHSILGVFR